jgi:hypothetical protein
MNPDLARRFERLERHKRELLEGVSGRDDAWLNRAPAPGAWSIVQVVSHLVLSETGTLTYIGKKLQGPREEIPRAGASAALRVRALSLALASPLKRQAPERVRPPGDPEPFDSVRGRWDELRSRWREQLENYPEELLGKAIFRHPFAGRFSMAQTLRFTDDHLQHHARQVERFKSLLG